jgi:DNA-binding transcriptional regulator YiaG
MRREEIREFRFSFGWSQEKFAFILGVSAKSVSRWENGKSKPSPLAEKRLRDLQKVKNCNELPSNHLTNSPTTSV